MAYTRKGHLLTCLVLVLVMAAAATAANAGLFGLFKSKPKVAPVVKQSLVLFPLDAASDVTAPAAFGDELASGLRAMLAGNTKYSVLVYRERLAPIVRAKADNTLKMQDVTPPFSEDKAKTLKLAQTLSSDFYLTGSVDSYAYDAAGKAALLVVSVQLHETKTGKKINEFQCSGKADESCKAVDESEYMAVAAGKAVEALRDWLVPKAVEPAKAAAPAAAESTPAAATTPATEAKPAEETKPAEADATASTSSEPPPAPPAN